MISAAEISAVIVHLVRLVVGGNSNALVAASRTFPHIITGNELLLTGFGMVFPLLGVAFSWWSFKWGEESATPDAYYDPSPDTSQEREILDHGIRERARTCARVIFNIGALLIAAGVPMSAAVEHARDSINGFALIAYAMVIFGLIYGARQVVAIWHSRRDTAFSWYYANNTMPYYYDADKTAALSLR